MSMSYSYYYIPMAKPILQHLQVDHSIFPCFLVVCFAIYMKWRFYVIA